MALFKDEADDSYWWQETDSLLMTTVQGIRSKR